MIVDRRNLAIKHRTHFLSTKWLGPFTITKVISQHTYKLDIPVNYYLPNVIYTSLLKPFRMRPQLQNDNNSEFDEEDIEFDVKAIIDSRKRRNRVE